MKEGLQAAVKRMAFVDPEEPGTTHPSGEDHPDIEQLAKGGMERPGRGAEGGSNVLLGELAFRFSGQEAEDPHLRP